MRGVKTYVCFSTAELGDVESLIDASEHIGKVDTLLTKIIMFWENMAVTLKYLRDDTNAGEVYLDKIENPKYAERFKRSIAEREKVNYLALGSSNFFLVSIE